MTINRSEVNRALAKAIAYKACGKEDKARAWGAELLRQLELADLINPMAAHTSRDLLDQ